MLYIPTRSDIEALEVGDTSLDCFGKQAKVTQITVRSEDINGKLFVYYYTALPTSNGQISMSQKEDKLVRHVGTSAKYTSHQLDEIEREMLSRGERVRKL